jgi:hypothetical protein
MKKKQKELKIYINTNKEMISSHFDGDSDLGKSNFVDYVLKSNIISYIEQFSGGVECITDSNFQNWNGGKHDQFAVRKGTLWCIHDDSGYEKNSLEDVEVVVEALTMKEIEDANIIEAKQESLYEKRMLCGETDGRKDDEQC